ncbi:MAG: agmatine deiminase family protein [Lachnospiraceae bacterium]|nr:agmatine deiminase family protein [Lachnospiraceae bacterium]
MESSRESFRMPAEFEPHDGCLMIWPERPGSWKDGVEAGKAFTTVACAIAESETVYMMVSPEKLEHAKKVVADYISKSRAYEESKDTDGKKPVSSESENAGKTDCDIVFIPFAADDSWARDTGPTFVINGKERRGVDWGFNAWGGDYDGLYADYDRDALVAGKLCEFLGDKRIDMRDFILEGGSIHVDGEGTLITTEECLLSPGRNPKLSKEEIENKLKETLGARKIIWLPTGVYNDETNGHVDNFCCFSAPGEVLLAWTDDENDPNYESCQKALGILTNEKDAKGRSFKIRKLSFPAEPVILAEKDLEGYIFEEGEDTREVGERLAASYVNFYISNGAVIYPCFGAESECNDIGKGKTQNSGNTESDGIAGKILAEAFPGREVIGVDARVILLGGGNIHCITQQIPKIK